MTAVAGGGVVQPWRLVSAMRRRRARLFGNRCGSRGRCGATSTGAGAAVSRRSVRHWSAIGRVARQLDGGHCDDAAAASGAIGGRWLRLFRPSVCDRMMVMVVAVAVIGRCRVLRASAGGVMLLLVAVQVDDRVIGG